jgi:hypothetical protein
MRTLSPRVAVIFALVGLLGVGLALSGSMRDGHGKTVTQTGIRPTWPMLGATKISLSDVRLISGLPARRPNDPLAKDDLIRTIWAMPGGEQIAYQYETGVEVNVQDGRWITDTYVTTDAFLLERAQGFADEFGMPVNEMLSMVQGKTALVIPQRLAGQENMGSVSFLGEGDIFVRVYAYLDSPTLLRIAESVG